MLANVPVPSKEQQLKQKNVVAHQSDDCPTMLSGWNLLRVTSTIDTAETSPRLEKSLQHWTQRRQPQNTH